MTSKAIETSPFIYQFAVEYSVFAYSMIAVRKIYIIMAKKITSDT